MEQADLKQSALSEQAGISKAAISQYLSGKNTDVYKRQVLQLGWIVFIAE